VSQERYQRLVESTKVIPFEANARTCRFTYIGPQAVKLFGYPREDWYREHFWPEHLHADDRARALAFCQEACRHEADFDFAYRMLTAEGRILWVREIVSTVRSEDGPEILRGFLIDITDRTLAKHALLESQTRLKLLTSIATGITSGMSVEQIIARTVKHINQHFPALRISYATVDEQGLLRVVHSHDPNGMHTLIGAEIDLGAAGAVLEIFRRHEPLIVAEVLHEPALQPLAQLLRENQILAALYVPVHYAEHLVGILGFDAPEPHHWREHEIATLREIAEYLAVAIKEARAQQERKRLEEERAAALNVANAELARAARLKDEFLASMSHELRTPLNAILGISEALREQVYGAVNDSQRNALLNIEESGRHLLSLINDILDLSRIEAGKLELEIDPISVESVCAASLRFIHQMAQHKQLKISVHYDPTAKIIHADERRLKQVLVNLLSNAVKFTPAGGAVGLEVWSEAQHEVMHFTVWDTGIGISMPDLLKLFQPFVQLDSSLSREYPGTGLGLVLVHRMVELHGGGVSVVSEPGKGSRFTVSLPWQKEAVFHAPEGEGMNVEGENTNVVALRPPVLVSANVMAETSAPLILIAEDNESHRKTLIDYLLGKQYRVSLSREGNEALARAREERPDLILMDIQMRGMSGLEAIRRMRSEVGLDTIPIIALTALAMPGDRERCLEAGATDYLSKPVSLKKLRAVIAARLQVGAKNIVL
ncbi:MAG: ATP-binding protein, partial [candidate division KSB1 bacterium]